MALLRRITRMPLRQRVHLVTSVFAGFTAALWMYIFLRSL